MGNCGLDELFQGFLVYTLLAIQPLEQCFGYRLAIAFNVFICHPWSISLGFETLAYNHLSK